MSVRQDETVRPRHLARGLLTGLLLVVAFLVTAYVWFFYGFALHYECNGSDASEPPEPGSDQAAICRSWEGLITVVFWLVPLLMLALAIVTGVLWTSRRLHGLWLLASVAAMVLSPILVYEGFASPDDVRDGSVQYERQADAARHR
jgi:ammonia channel protein AmtB